MKCKKTFNLTASAGRLSSGEEALLLGTKPPAVGVSGLEFRPTWLQWVSFVNSLSHPSAP